MLTHYETCVVGRRKIVWENKLRKGEATGLDIRRGIYVNEKLHSEGVIRMALKMSGLRPFHWSSLKFVKFCLNFEGSMIGLQYYKKKYKFWLRTQYWIHLSSFWAGLTILLQGWAPLICSSLNSRKTRYDIPRRNCNHKHFPLETRNFLFFSLISTSIIAHVSWRSFSSSRPS